MGTHMGANHALAMDLTLDMVVMGTVTVILDTGIRMGVSHVEGMVLLQVIMGTRMQEEEGMGTLMVESRVEATVDPPNTKTLLRYHPLPPIWDTGTRTAVCRVEAMDLPQENTVTHMQEGTRTRMVALPQRSKPPLPQMISLHK